MRPTLFQPSPTTVAWWREQIQFSKETTTMDNVTSHSWTFWFRIQGAHRPIQNPVEIKSVNFGDEVRVHVCPNNAQMLKKVGNLRNRVPLWRAAGHSLRCEDTARPRAGRPYLDRACEMATGLKSPKPGPHGRIKQIYDYILRSPGAIGARANIPDLTQPHFLDSEMSRLQ